VTDERDEETREHPTAGDDQPTRVDRQQDTPPAGTPVIGQDTAPHAQAPPTSLSTRRREMPWLASPSSESLKKRSLVKAEIPKETKPDAATHPPLFHSN